MEIDNPSVRFYCLHKEILDNILKDLDPSRKSGNHNVLKLTLEMYIEYRSKIKCEGCKIGEGRCKHWSPEKEEPQFP